MDTRTAGATTGRVRKKKRSLTLLWIVAAAIVIISLIYWEQTALLYVISTLGVTALLVVVAFADLSGARKITREATAPADDAAAIGSGLATQSAATNRNAIRSDPSKRR